MTVDCTRINNVPLTTSFLGNNKRHERVQQHPQQTRWNQPSPDHGHVATQTVLENWINVSTGRSQPGFHVSNKTKHTLLVRIQVRTS